MTDATKDDTIQDRVHDAYAHARETASHVYEETRTKAEHAVEISKKAVDKAAHRTIDGVEANPLGILVGGLAFGALIGAALPRSAREKALLGPIGRKLGAAAGVAVAAAREAGQSELENAGLTRDAAKQQVRGLFDNVLKVASSASNAAVKSTSTKS